METLLAYSLLFRIENPRLLELKCRWESPGGVLKGLLLARCRTCFYRSFGSSFTLNIGRFADAKEFCKRRIVWEFIAEEILDSRSRTIAETLL